MDRKYYKDLADWKNRSNRKPLVIRGARQVGKTYLVREFGNNEYEHFIEINFDETPDKVDLFKYKDIETIIRYISLFLYGIVIALYSFTGLSGTLFGDVFHWYEKGLPRWITWPGFMVHLITHNGSSNTRKTSGWNYLIPKVWRASLPGSSRFGLHIEYTYSPAPELN